MSEPTKTKLPVPEGQSFLLRTKQMAPNEKGFVGYETIWGACSQGCALHHTKAPLRA
ncbi:MAG: hypothetical protein IPN04_01340 [Rhodoferax sp.]|nr:hypothetical protein [Rhodoferax sp.]